MTAEASRANSSAAPTSGSRIMRRLDELAACTEEPGRITRPYLSPAHRKAADLVGTWMAGAGMTARVDAIGNVVARYEGAAPDSPVLVLGSHIDSVPNGGIFDGTLGVLTAIEVVCALNAAGKRMPFAIDVVAFGDEEGRFPSTLGGSRMLAGSFDPKILDEKDASGISRRDALVSFGCDPRRIPEQAGRRGRVLGYVEVHIEQGPVLEGRGLAVGVVTAINGATRGMIEVRGMRGHAGTVPMQLRQDAYCAAAEMALAIERRALLEDDLVATVGRIEIPGGVVNTIPGVVQFTIDVRSPSDAHRLAAIADLDREMNAIAARRRVEIAITLGYQAPAAPCDPRLSDFLSDAVLAQGIVPLRLPSGAGHDAMSFRNCWPIAMLFVRCRGGVSHSPDEFASLADIETAARTLYSFVEAFGAHA
jgi:allantoate deiminase